MKKSLFYLFSILLGVTFYSCTDDDDDEYLTSQVTITLVYPDSSVLPTDGVVVTLRNTVNDTSYDAETDTEGKAVFNVPTGTYEASASETRVDGPDVTLYNGLNSNVVVGGQPVEVNLRLTASNGGSIVVKELYVGGCPDDQGGSGFAMDQSFILYNNSSVTIDLSDFVFAMVNPYNATSSNKDYENGALFYENEGWIPAGMGVWYFPNPVSLESGKQMVIVHTGAIDNTVTYSQSINYANADYYCCYDPEVFANTKYYPTPADIIPTSHYLKAIAFGLGNAWVFSQISPAFFIFRPEGTDLKSFIDDESTTNYYGGSTSMPRKKVPVDWIVDGVEVFSTGVDGALKRLTASVDAGYISFTKKLGHTLYRNVDKEATEALPVNQDKLVYNYAGGFNGSTDPSGIDAEASIKNGARIIYKDTNNSTNDFHERMKSSLRN